MAPWRRHGVPAASALFLLSACSEAPVEEPPPAAASAVAETALPPLPPRPRPARASRRVAPPEPPDPTLVEAAKAAARAEAEDQLDLVEALGSKDPGQAASAREALRARHGAAREALVGGLEHPSPDVRYHAAVLLMQLDDVSVDPVLIRRLRDPDARVREAAAEALAGPPDDAETGYAPELLAMLRRAKPPEPGDTATTGEGLYKQAIAIAIGHTIRAREIPLLFDLLKDPDPEIRRAGVRTLEEVSGRKGKAVPVPGSGRPRTGAGDGPAPSFGFHEEWWREWWDYAEEDFKTPAERRIERRRARIPAPSPRPGAP